jgi:hypothetical protein
MGKSANRQRRDFFICRFTKFTGFAHKKTLREDTGLNKQKPVSLLQIRSDYRLNIQLPDNGGVAVVAYLHPCRSNALGTKLPGPFFSGARTDFSATTGSLNVASEGTIPVRSCFLILMKIGANFNTAW